ncbi:carboxyl transferase domain-containing protein [Phascolarctobacterium faecium]
MSGVVPQISVVLGPCLGTAALCAVSADFVILSEKAEFFSIQIY